MWTEVRKEALAALSRIMKRCPLLRPSVVYAAADMVLGIPDTNDILIYHGLHQVQSLLCSSCDSCLLTTSGPLLRPM